MGQKTVLMCVILNLIHALKRARFQEQMFVLANGVGGGEDTGVSSVTVDAMCAAQTPSLESSPQGGKGGSQLANGHSRSEPNSPLKNNRHATVITIEEENGDRQ